MIFPSRSPASPNQRPPQAGFALIITIILMSMMVLLMVSMASLTRVETQIAANYQKADQARENALYALKIALGQLQKHVGPDQRATARADILGAATRSATDTWSGSAVTPLNSTVFHNNSLLTGVWGNSANSTAAAANSAYVNTPQLLTWLVSGNETASYATKTTAVDFGRVNTAVTVVPGTYTPASAFTPSTANPAVQLIGPMTVGGTRNADGTITATTVQKAAMVAAITQPITVASRMIPGQAATDTPIAVGRYAYWVGDEGVKAKFNIVDPWGDPDATATTDAEKRYRYQVAQRAGIELMTRVDATTKLADGPIGSASYDQAGANGRLSISKMISYNSIPLGNAVLQATTQARFHDLTTYSHGVLSNTRDGGLKKDLTAAFAPGTTSATAPTGKLWSIPSTALGASYGPNMLAATTTNTYDGLGPDWQVLRSFAQLGTVVTGSGTAASMDPIAPAAPAATPTEQTQMGVHPVIVGYHFFTSSRLVKRSDGQYEIELRHIPAVMLWNPYNVTLKDANYGFRLDFTVANTVFFARLTQGTSATTEAAFALNAATHIGSPYFYKFAGKDTTSGTARGYPIHFEAQSGDMEPGRAYAYALAADADTNDTIAANYPAGTYKLTRGWIPNGVLGFGIVARSAPFAAPALPVPSTDSYYLRLYWSAGAANSNLPNSNEKPDTPASSTSSRLIMRLGSVTGPDLQLVTGGYLPHVLISTAVNSRVGPILLPPKTVPTSFPDSLTGTPSTPLDGSNWGYKVVLKGTEIISPNGNHSIYGAVVPWVSSYNPRAAVSATSAWECQRVGGSGYYASNPSIVNNVAASAGAATAAPYYPVTESSEGYYRFAVNSSTPTVLFDIPRASQPIQSLGALQHANLYRALFDLTANKQFRLADNTSPAYVIGNSKADQRVGATLPYGFFDLAEASYITSSNVQKPVYFDHSYLANRALWDGYCFSTVPTSGALTFPLPNGRHVLAGAAKTNDTTDLRNADRAASRLLVDGSFNINSTSEEAWRAVLASTLNTPVGSQAFPDQAPVPRLVFPRDDSAVMSATNTATTNVNSYGGYRSLTSAQITALATQMVAQVKARGPFVSLGDFVNRALVDNPATAADERLSGALHSAIAAAGINNAFFLPDGTPGVKAKLPLRAANVAPYLSTGAAVDALSDTAADTAATSAGTYDTSPAAAMPGWVTQADLLQVLGPVLSARSDTFVVRVYGEVLDPLLSTGDAKHVQARAWAEAIVQRMPEYIDPNDSQLTTGDATPPSVANSTNQQFGRRLKIIFFRWLSPSDI